MGRAPRQRPRLWHHNIGGCDAGEEYVAGPPRTSGAWHRKPGPRRYEINYTDSTGKLRWKTVEGGVREARSARAEIIATPF
jgi:hypothetical protein